MQQIRCNVCDEEQDADRPYCVFCGQPASTATRDVQKLEAIQEVEEVALDDLWPKDYLIIQTEHSLYRLMMIEPARRLGVLSGGKLGSRGIRVMLVATTPTSAQGMGGEVMTIRTRSRALFVIDAEEGIEHFITSVITKLTQGRGGQTPGR